MKGSLRIMDLGPWLHLLLMTSFLYVIPFGPDYEAIRVKVFVIAAFVSIVLLNKVSINDVFMLLGAAFVISALMLMNHNEYAAYIVGFALLLYSTVLSNLKISHNKTLIWFVCFALCLFVLYQLESGDNRSDGRAVLSVGDPNFSAYYLFLIFLLANKIGSRFLVFYTLIVSFLFLSKNFFLAVLVYYFISLFKEDIYLLSKKLRFGVGFYFISAHVFILALSLSSILELFKQSYSPTDSMARLVNITNSSDLIRIRINVDAVRETFSSVEAFMFGVDMTQFHAMYVNLPHNALFYVMASSGFVYTAIFFLSIIYLLNKKFSAENIPYIFSYIVFGMFLHSNYSMFGFLFFYYIISMRLSTNELLVFNPLKPFLRKPSNLV